MARFMDIHEGFVGVTKEQLAEAHAADLAIEAEEGVHFEKAWLDPESGKVFCLSTGPSKEAVCASTSARVIQRQKYTN
ncbi:MAG: gualylate cyclase [Rhodoglobus sp.]|nr:gualylate cyclase [Rhodoglobus sp.]